MPRKTTILIYDGDDMERLADLRREVAIAERFAAEAEREAEGVPRRLGDETDAEVTEAKAAVKAKRDAYDAFVDEAAERAEEWEIHAIGHEDFRKLLRDHPPRKVPKEDGEGEVTHPEDAGWDLNSETFPKALLTFVDPDDDEVRTVLEPACDSIAALKKRIKRLSAGEFDSLWVAAWSLNNGAIADPKASIFSPAGRKSTET